MTADFGRERRFEPPALVYVSASRVPCCNGDNKVFERTTLHVSCAAASRFDIGRNAVESHTEQGKQSDSGGQLISQTYSFKLGQGEIDRLPFS